MEGQVRNWSAALVAGVGAIAQRIYSGRRLWFILAVVASAFSFLYGFIAFLVAWFLWDILMMLNFHIGLWIAVCWLLACALVSAIAILVGWWGDRRELWRLKRSTEGAPAEVGRGNV